MNILLLGSGGREQPLGLEPRLELRQQGQQRALARDLHPLDHDLVGRTARINRKLAAGDDLDPVLGHERQALRGAAPHHRVDHRALVLEAAVEMSTRRALDPRELAAKSDEAEAVLDRALE